MGFNDSFGQLRTQFLLMEPEQLIQRAFSLVAQEVEQHVFTFPATTNVNNASTMMVRGSSHYKKKQKR